MVPIFLVESNHRAPLLSLAELLSNTLVLYQTAPYLPIASLLALASTSQSLRRIIYDTPNVFRRLDLCLLEKPDKVLGEYCQPVLDLFKEPSKHRFLRDVQVLVLDGLPIHSKVPLDIIRGDTLRVRILSIRETWTVDEHDEHQMQNALVQSICRRRPADQPGLEGLYLFGRRDVSAASQIRNLDHSHTSISMTNMKPEYGGVLAAEGAQIGAEIPSEATVSRKDIDVWYQNSGRVLDRTPSLRWATVIELCRGIISFDAVLCSGPRHTLGPNSDRDPTPWYTHPDMYREPQVATHAVGGCSTCHTAPEGFATFGKSPLDRFPLLAPPPLHSPTSKAAKTPFSSASKHSPSPNKLLVRCITCLHGRFCNSCHKWWCEDCYAATEPLPTVPTTRPPWNVIHGGYKTNMDTEKQDIKVHMGLCVANCLVREMMSGAGSNGMWG